jgi:anti-anti-sigma regulatory factor
MGDTLRVKTEKLPTGGVVATVLLENVTDFDLTPLGGDLRDSMTTGGGKIAVDMSQVIILGSAGLGLLLNLRKEAVSQKGKFIIFGLSDDLMGVMKATKLNTLLTITKDRKSALAALD